MRVPSEASVVRLSTCLDRIRMNRETFEQDSRDFAVKIVELLKRGAAPWTKPWRPGELVPQQNIKTGQAYRGGNIVRLLAEAEIRGFTDERWGTYKQIEDMGGQVRKGEHGIRLLRLVRSIKKKKGGKEQALLVGDAEHLRKDKKGKPSKGPEGSLPQDAADVEYYAGYFTSFIAFNAEQADGLPERTQRQPEQWQPDKKAESVLDRSGASSILHTSEGRAYYTLASDRIVLPYRRLFDDAAGYYATALHELGHWTGHPDRLNRDTLVTATSFGSRTYAREELRAEIASLMIASHLGLGHDPKPHAAYVKSWVQVLEDDHSEIFRASHDAQEISDYVLDPPR